MPGKMVSLAVVVALFLTSDIAGETYPTHPDLSADAASAIVLAESTGECELSEAVAVEIEGLLSRLRIPLIVIAQSGDCDHPFGGA